MRRGEGGGGGAPSDLLAANHEGVKDHKPTGPDQPMQHGRQQRPVQVVRDVDQVGPALWQPGRQRALQPARPACCHPRLKVQPKRFAHSAGHLTLRHRLGVKTPVQ